MMIEFDDAVRSDRMSVAKRRAALLSRSATRDTAALRRRPDPTEDPVFRPPFFRDADRIIHTHAYARYIDKTQVFFNVENDHITHRALHVQLVAKVGRTIGRALGLNEDLIEAVALGHDIGHAPYGHVGEMMLDELSQEHGLGPFRHNVQGVRCLEALEGCNLTLQTLDGILSHDGEENDLRLEPALVETWEEFDRKVDEARHGGSIVPATFESCVVRFADSIAYLGRDLEDAIEIGLVDGIDGLPGTCRDVFGIGERVGIARAVLDVAIKDLVNESSARSAVGFSSEVAHAVRLFKEFNYREIYLHDSLVGEREAIRSMFGDLFEHSLREAERGDPASPIYRDHLDIPWLAPAYRDTASPAMAALDYIAGMTDRYFNRAVAGCRPAARVDPVRHDPPPAPRSPTREGRSPAEGLPGPAHRGSTDPGRV